MKIPSALGAGLIIAVSIIGPGRADTKPPYEIVRSLEALHDQMALGSRAAQAEMPAVLRKLGERLVDVEPSVWRDPRNVWAVVVYILSGGEIRVARKVLASGKCTVFEKQLVAGALAYLEGNKTQAESLLENVDPRSLDPAVGGYIALARAALLADDNPSKALNLLDVARVLAPGTLVEDAALRREAFLAVKTADFDKFVAISDQYLRRFSKSVYAASFRRNLEFAILHLSAIATPVQLTALSRLMTELSRHEQLKIYLYVAQDSVMNGRIDAAKWSARQAAKLAPRSGTEERRAILYDGVVSILTPDYARGLAELDQLDGAHLPHNDGLLRDAALGLAAQVRQWPELPKEANKTASTAAGALASPPGVSSSPLPAPLAGVAASSDAMIAQAQKMLADSDTILKDQIQ